MATTTAYATSNSGALESYDADYATARAGGAVGLRSDSDARVGQYLYGGTTRFCFEEFLEFDLSGLSGATITGATLSLFVWGIDGTPGVIEARARDFGSGVSVADWVPGADLAGLTELATYTAAAPDTVYKAFTSTGLVGWLTPGAVNRMVLASANIRTGTPPSAAEYITAYFSNYGGQPPKLDITYTAAAPPATGHSGLALRGVG